MRATTDGENVRAVISTKVKTPNALAIDLVARRLYWADATLDKVERCDFDGRNRQVPVFYDACNVYLLYYVRHKFYCSN